MKQVPAPTPVLSPYMFRLFKYGIYLLLVANVAALTIRRGIVDAIDSIGWLLLVAMMEYETRTPRPHRHHWLASYLALVVRLAGYGLVLHAWSLYHKLDMWLDLANATLWLLVCAALEYDVYVHSRLPHRERALRRAVKLTLYGMLVGCAGLWGLREDWLAFYDALLWLLAFFAIELNVFGLPHVPAAPPAKPQPPSGAA